MTWGESYGRAEDRIGDWSRHRGRPRRIAGAVARRLCGRARRTAQGKARRSRARGQRHHTGRSSRRQRPGLHQGAVRQDQRALRPARRAVQQCRHRRAGNLDRRPAARQVAGGGRHQSDRPVRLHPGSDQDHEGAGPARRTRRAPAPPPTPRPSTPSPGSPNKPRSTAGPTRSAAARSTSATPRPRSPNAWCRATACPNPTAAR